MNWKKILLIAVAIGAFSFAAVPRSEARVRVGIGFGFPIGFSYGYGYPYGYGYGYGYGYPYDYYGYPRTGKPNRRPTGEKRCGVHLDFVDETLIERLTENVPAALDENTRDFFRAQLR